MQTREVAMHTVINPPRKFMLYFACLRDASKSLNFCVLQSNVSNLKQIVPGMSFNSKYSRESVDLVLLFEELQKIE